MNASPARSSLFNLGLLLLGAAAILVPDQMAWAVHETPFGEIEGRPVPVSRRQCLGGPNFGQLCNEDADCAPSTCQDRNVYNLTVSVRFNATAAQLTTIQNAMNDMADSLWDVTDGQAQIGQITILNNSVGAGGDIWVTAAAPCAGGGSLCASSGHFGTGGRISAWIGRLGLAGAGEGLAHEFVHLVFDARDEYESRAAGCGAVLGGAQCPTAPGEERCLMDQGGTGVMSTELCWSGNHEPALVTEQSRCRSNRSCWEQIGWSWPNTFLVPAGAPDPGANGKVLDPVSYLQPANNARIVLVLDTSGSMSAEAPTRMDRLQTAALDFVNLAANGVELGLVSFTTTATDEVAIAPLGANRVAYTTAISNLTPLFRTNIGDGLQHARDMIAAAGGVTGNTAIVLMTDGRNNEPQPSPQTDLQAKIDMLLMQGIPVYVTCTGDDLGLESQCAEIAAGTGGTYVDSASADGLPDAFGLFHELIMGREIIASQSGFLAKLDGYTATVEPGATLASFLLQWKDPGSEGQLLVTDPLGNTFQGIGIPLGQYVRIPAPEPGDYQVQIINQGSNLDTYSSRAFVENQELGISLGVRRASVNPGEEIVLFGIPRFLGPVAGVQMAGLVTKPDGTQVPFELKDGGRTAEDTGDDLANDGVYTNTFRDTAMPGAYMFDLKVVSVGGALAGHSRTQEGTEVIPPNFLRELRVSFSVVDPRIGSELCIGTGFAEPGTTVTVPIVLDDGDGVAGFQVEVRYDATVLSPAAVNLGADTAAAGGWSVSSATVAPGTLRVLGASNPPAGLLPGPAEVARVDFTVVAGSALGFSQLGLQNCVLSDKLGLEVPCGLCQEPGVVIVRPASRFQFRPIGDPVGVDKFDPLPFLVSVEAINAFGGTATGYNGTADMVIPGGICASSLQPNALGFSGGLGADFFQAACCIDPILPDSTTSLVVEGSDPAIAVSGTSAPFLGAAKGDLDANNKVDVLDVIRTTRLSLSLPVAVPPSLGFQRWAGDMLDPACAADGTNNVLDVVRVSNKALNLPPLCPCSGNLIGGNEAVFAPGGPVGFGVEKVGKREFLITVENAADLGGFQLELRGAGPKAEVVLDGLTGRGDWQVATATVRGVLRVIAYSTAATGVNGDGAVLRIREAGKPHLQGTIASDSRGREMKVR